MKKLLIVALLLLASLLTTAYFPEVGPRKPSPSLIPLGQVEITTYQAVPEQTDGDPFMTASGVDLRQVSERICALSQDLLRHKKGPAWKDRVILCIPGRPDLSGPWTVVDTMHERVTQHVDLLIDEYDKWSGYAWLVKEKWR
ncbi:MAG: hypothetical protein KAY24_00170 [Candidatus Eisenbacteria sp.]|nr:hypothetical protein [Candidatus Eisenbacteria bacterium]